MKFTATPTNPPRPGASAAATATTVTVEHPYDDLGAEDVIALFRRLMLGMGFAESTVTEYLGEE